jgi:dephospho-CoA kinase
VARDRAAFLEENTAADIVVLDIPLLFETGGTRLVDRVAVVSTSPKNNAAAFFHAPEWTKRLSNASWRGSFRMREKRARADFVIRTDDLATARSRRGTLAEPDPGRKKDA